MLLAIDVPTGAVVLVSCEQDDVLIEGILRCAVSTNKVC